MSAFVKNHFMLFVFSLFFLALGAIVLMSRNGGEKSPGKPAKGEVSKKTEIPDPAVLQAEAKDAPSVPERTVDPFPVFPDAAPVTASLEMAPSEPGRPVAENGHVAASETAEDPSKTPPPVVNVSGPFSIMQEQPHEQVFEPILAPEPVSETAEQAEESTPAEAGAAGVPFFYVYEIPRRGGPAIPKVYIFPLTTAKNPAPEKAAPASPDAPLAWNPSMMPALYGPMPVTKVTPVFPMTPIYRPVAPPAAPFWMPKTQPGFFGADRLVYPNGVILRQKAFTPRRHER